NMQGYPGTGLGFLEGDEFVWVDGKKQPSWNGTGTEDYFISGWYFNRGTFSAPYHALTIKDEARRRISVYRFQIPDAIPFRKSIRVAIEHGHANESRCDYSSVAYWYQTEPHAPRQPLPDKDYLEVI
ncbi:MAG: DUF2961 domain-containing protein, partial [Alicyclobacillus sp.]|nr:DUF2961 domain-containing protein [Alicyclobacillus sp.]